MIIRPNTLLAKCWVDRIRLIAIENMKGAFGNEGALLSSMLQNRNVDLTT
jgi:hypothetical protein